MKTKINESASDYLMSHLEVCKTKEDLILVFWFYWVESVTTNKIDFQKVLACSAVNKWFLIELKKEETEFKALIEKYPDTEGKDKDWLYCKHISRLMSRFPKILLDDAKKREQKTTKVNGLKVKISIEQQN